MSARKAALVREATPTQGFEALWRHYGGRYSPSDYELPARFWLARRQLWLPYQDQPQDTDGIAPWGEL